MVGIKIQNVFDHMGRGMVDQALAELYSAVRITASGVYDSALDGDVQCRRFLHDRMEIILGTWLGTVAAPGLHIAPRKESDVCIPMEDILLDLPYDVITRAQAATESVCLELGLEMLSLSSKINWIL